MRIGARATASGLRPLIRCTDMSFQMKSARWKPASAGSSVPMKHIAAGTHFLNSKSLRQGRLSALRLQGGAFPVRDTGCSKTGAMFGCVTSGLYSPLMQKGIAMALLEKGDYQPGTGLEVLIRERPVSALTVGRPFYPYRD